MINLVSKKIFTIFALCGALSFAFFSCTDDSVNDSPSVVSVSSGGTSSGGGVSVIPSNPSNPSGGAGGNTESSNNDGGDTGGTGSGEGENTGDKTGSGDNTDQGGGNDGSGSGTEPGVGQGGDGTGQDGGDSGGTGSGDNTDQGGGNDGSSGEPSTKPGDDFVYIKGETLTADVTYSGYTSTGVRKEDGSLEKGNITKKSSVLKSGLKINPYYICKHEVTQKEWNTLINNQLAYFDGSDETCSLDSKNGKWKITPTTDGKKENQDNRPVERISYCRIVAYCNRRSVADNRTPCYSIKSETDPSKWGSIPSANDETTLEKWKDLKCDFTANGYRLPTEAEWEYAANANKGYLYSGFSNEDNGKDEYTWDTDNSTIDSGGTTLKNTSSEKNRNPVSHEVMTKKPNDWGIFDMAGNIGEIVWGLYVTDGDKKETTTTAIGWLKDTTNIPNITPIWTVCDTKIPRISVRGGGYSRIHENCYRCVVRAPIWSEGTWGDKDIGFRVVVTAK